MRTWTKDERSRWFFHETGLDIQDIVISDRVLTWAFDYGLHLEPIELGDAKEFVRAHHRHCNPPQGWMYGRAVFNDPDRVGVMTAGGPTSRHLDTQGCIEVTRVCVVDIQPKELTSNACSMLYGYACQEAFRRGHKRVVTYTRLDELGTSLRAAGFVPVAISRGGSWNRRGRLRRNPIEDVPRVRWERWSDGARLPKQLPLAFPKHIELARAA